MGNKLTFSWPETRDVAKASNLDLERLREQPIVYQIDFLSDVISEATRLHEEALKISRAEFQEIRDAAATHS